MNYIKLMISTTGDRLDALCDRLCGADIAEFEVVGADFGVPLNDGELPPDEDFALGGAEPAVCVYVAQNEAEKIEEIKQIEFGFDVNFTTETINHEDWANSWKQYFKPIFVGEKIIICPEWEVAPTDTGRTVFYINPGMSFGTGSHETTRLCIQQLERFVTADTTVLDLGCGSGILSVIACLLGAKSAVAVDIDPQSAETARENADKNGISSERYQAFAGDVLSDGFIDGKYDIVVANIVADIIIKIAGKARDLIAENGVFIAGGIIIDRLDEVKSALEASGFTIKSVEIDGEWAVLVCD
ncbi:MAG: 50S ribosomal protein L11 methyltransferase [Oscillospiraceae bacterium]|nr:50S ribosomal protein L11 methyltransferase [Oscillospiraceae bacterium]